MNGKDPSNVVLFAVIDKNSFAISQTACLFKEGL